MGRAPCCDKANVKKGPWSPEEDSKLKQYIHKFGTGGNWITLPHKAGLKRCGKSCRLRWLNYLRPNIKHGEFSEEEDRIICTLFTSIGSRWSIIASQLPGRTDNDIKNYWNTKLKKKLKELQTHMHPPNSFTTSHHKSRPPSFPISPSLHHFQSQQPFHHQSPLSLLHKDLNMMTYPPTLTSPIGNFPSGFEILPNISTPPHQFNYTSLFQTKESHVGSMKKNLNLIMFGSERSCFNKQVEMGLGFQIDDQNSHNKFTMLNYPNNTSHHSYANNNNDQWGETHFGDYDLEDIKHLISSSSNSSKGTNVNIDNGSMSNSLFSFDRNKSDNFY